MKKLLVISLLFVGLNSSLNASPKLEKNTNDQIETKEAQNIKENKLHEIKQNAVVLASKAILVYKNFTDSQKKLSEENKIKLSIGSKCENPSVEEKKFLAQQKYWGRENLYSGLINATIHYAVKKHVIPKLIENTNNKIINKFVLSEFAKKYIKRFSPFKKDDTVTDAFDLTVDGYDLYKDYKKLNTSTQAFH